MPLNFTREMMVGLVERNFEELVKEEKEKDVREEINSNIDDKINAIEQTLEHYIEDKIDAIEEKWKLYIDERIKNLELYVKNGLRDKQDKDDNTQSLLQEIRLTDAEDGIAGALRSIDSIEELCIDERIDSIENKIKNLELYLKNGLHDKHVLQTFKMPNGKLHTLFTHNRAILLNDHTIIGSLINGKFEIFQAEKQWNVDSKKNEYINKFHGLLYEDFIAK
jgi:hypothetical protein